MPIEDVVNIVTSRGTKSVSQEGFSTINILGINKAFVPLLKYYSNTAAVLVDHTSTSKEYLAASVAFAQSPPPARIAISRRATDDTTVITVDTVTNLSSYSITYGTNVYSIVSDSDATAIEIVSALKVAFDLGLEPATFTDNLDGTYNIVPTVPGTQYTLNVDSKQSMAFTLSTTPAADIAAISLEQDDWYGLVYTERVEADILLIAAYVETVKKVFGVTDYAADSIDTTDSADTSTLTAQLKALGYARTFVNYHVSGATAYAESAALGSMLPLNPGEWTLLGKTLTGISADVLSDTQRTNALEKHMNIHTETGGVNMVEKGTMIEGEFIDVIIFIDWLDARMAEYVFGLFVNNNKVAYTDAGITSIEAEMIRALQQGVAIGGINPDDGSGGPAFTTSVPLEANVSAADKASRTLNNVTYTAELAGAIHVVNITGVIVL